MLQALGMCFYFGKNALSTFAFLVFVRVCVAAIGALRFSARGFGCALFYYSKRVQKKQSKERGRQMSESMGTKEAAEKWGYKQSTISKWCREGKIPGADHDAKGSPWHIPKNAICPMPMKTNTVA